MTPRYQNGNVQFLESGNQTMQTVRVAAPTDDLGRMTVSVMESAHSVTLSVSDNGPGVSATQLKQLTRRWVQGSAGDALKEGSGLGLAIVSEYARLLDAKVQVDLETPHGLRVSVTLRRPL